MNRIRFAVAGTGWRALFYVRAAKNLPEWFELTGVLCRTPERAESFEKEYGVKTFTDLDALLDTKPEFVVNCIYKAELADMSIRLMERGMPVLCETPFAVNLEKLEELREVQKRTGVRLEMAEQYFLYPGHAARVPWRGNGQGEYPRAQDENADYRDRRARRLYHKRRNGR